MLATEATALLHGRAAADEAAETARKTFEEGALAESLPTVEVERASLEAGHGPAGAVRDCRLAASNGEARRHVQGGAVRVNDEPVKDERRVDRPLPMSAPEGVIKLSLGRKKHVLVRPV